MSHNNLYTDHVYDELKHVWPDAVVFQREPPVAYRMQSGDLEITVSINRHNRRFEVTHLFSAECIPPMHVIRATMRKQFTEQVHNALAEYQP